MEDDKLAAYYDELTRKGGGAARFKQGLGFSSPATSNDGVPARGSALPATTSASFLSSFVRASSPSKTDQLEKQAQLQSIQSKLTKKPQPKTLNSRSRSRSPSQRRSRSRDRYSGRRRSRSRSRDKHSRRRSRSRSRSKSRSRSRDRHSRRRSRSRSRERRSKRSHRSRSREKNRERRKREESPEKGKKGKGGGSGVDFAKLIQGYDHMTPAERVKAKMKLQLSRTAENDEAIGKGAGWERFDFDKDAPLDDEEIEAGDDDAAIVKHVGQSFRLSAVEARNEEQIRAAHDEAMFGGSSCPPHAESDDEGESDKKKNNESAPVTNLLSDKVLTMQRGSWRDRARKT